MWLELLIHDPLTRFIAQVIAIMVVQEPSGGMVNILMAYDKDPLEVGIGRDWGLEQRMVGVVPERLMQESPVEAPA